MTKGFDKFLLGTLWLIAMTLASSFWFNIRFGFNLFSREHWKYLSELQITGINISKSFYFSFVIVTIISIIGIYILIHHSHKTSVENKTENIPIKIALPVPDKNQIIPMVKKTETDAQQSLKVNEDLNQSNVTKIPVRPPKLSISPNSMQMMVTPQQPTSNLLSTTNKPSDLPIINSLSSETNFLSSPEIKPVYNRLVNNNDMSTISDIFKNAGYIVKQPPKIDDVRPNIWAIGSNENLFIGIAIPTNGNVYPAEGGDSKWTDENGKFESPVWQISKAKERLNALFVETLDEDIKVNIQAFIVLTGDGKIENPDSAKIIWDAFEIKVFNSMNELQQYILLNKNTPPEPGSDTEDFEAYEEYIDTVADYFNKS